VKGLENALKINIKPQLKQFSPEMIFKVFRKYVLESDRYKEAMLDIIYPKDRACAVCGNKLENSTMLGVCAWCMDILPLITDPFCEKCGKPKKADNEICVECDGVHNHFERAMSVFEYTAGVQRLIYRFKYRGEQHLSYVFGGFLAKRLKEQKNWDYSALVAVPLHRKRHRERGFNQSALLAKEIALRLDVPVLFDALSRTKETSVQAGLGRQERFANLSQAFSVNDKSGIQGKRVVLVDDIFTTGSTVNECSRVLLEAGAEKVYVLTVATGRPK
jgi:ComF family protein